MRLETIRLSHDNGIPWLVLNRPQALNAFTVQMAGELIEWQAPTLADLDECFDDPPITNGVRDTCRTRR